MDAMGMPTEPRFAPSQDQLVAPKIAMCVKRIPHKVRFGGFVRSSFWLVGFHIKWGGGREVYKTNKNIKT